jgi:hypothetical protein
MAADMRRPRREGAGSTLPELKGGAIVTCSEDGCDRPLKASGLCSACYQRRWKAGTLPERRRKRDGLPHTCTVHEPSRACYSAHRCRCDGCRDSNVSYETRRSRQAVYGQAVMVDAGPVRAHVEMLSAAGLGKIRLAEITGVSPTAIEKLKRKSKRVRKETADAILGVESWRALRSPVQLAQIGKNPRCVECEAEPLFGGMRCLSHFQAKVRANRGEHGCLMHPAGIYCYQSCRCRCQDCRDAVNMARKQSRAKQRAREAA